MDPTDCRSIEDAIREQERRIAEVERLLGSLPPPKQPIAMLALRRSMTEELARLRSRLDAGAAGPEPG